jgi:hypothetical protein
VFSSVLRRVRHDGHRLYVEDDHGTALRIFLGSIVIIGFGVLVAAAEQLFRAPAPELYAVALVLLAAVLTATVVLVRVQHRSMVTTMAWADLAGGSLTTREGHIVPISVVVPEIVESSTPIDSETWVGHEKASNWLLQLRLPDRVLPLGTSLAPRGRVPPALLSFAHELHRLGFAPPALALLDPPAPAA